MSALTTVLSAGHQRGRQMLKVKAGPVCNHNTTHVTLLASDTSKKAFITDMPTPSQDLKRHDQIEHPTSQQLSLQHVQLTSLPENISRPFLVFKVVKMVS